MNNKKFQSLQEFYPFYLSEHQNTTSRVLHFIGTTLVIFVLIAAVLFHLWRALLLLPLIGYGFAWLGHFFFEKNRPATFKYPWYSLASDFMFFWDIVNSRQGFKVK